MDPQTRVQRMDAKTLVQRVMRMPTCVGEYPTRFFYNLNKMYTDMESSYPDVTLLCVKDNTEHPCHKIILAACSEYFKNLFAWGGGDGGGVIEVHNDISSDTLNDILQFIYSGHITITTENVSDLLVACNFLDVMPVLGDCIDFITDNLEVSTCVDMLLLSWHLNLDRMTRKIVTFIALNFPMLMEDMDMMATVPVELMSQVLRSTDLLIRHPETRLPTLPGVRERRVLEFILAYTKALDSFTEDDIDTLMLCVKWKFIDIFDEKECVDYVAHSLGDGLQYKEAVLRNLNFNHSDWFRYSSDLSKATYRDKHEYKTRSFSCSRLVWLEPLASAGRSSSVNPFLVRASQDEHITRLDVLTRTWYNKTVVGGFKIYVKSVKSGENEIEKSENDAVCQHVGITEEQATNVHSVMLKEGEHITRVRGSSGHLVNTLQFETSNSRSVDICNEGGRAEGVTVMDSDIVMKRKWKQMQSHGATPLRVPLDTILVGISGNTVMAQHQPAITGLSFCFRMKIPDSSFVVTNTKLCEFEWPEDSHPGT